MSTKLEQMEKQRARLNAEIRATKRAEAKRHREAVLASRQALGVWLADAVSADTPEAVARLREALDTDQVREYIAKRLGVETSTTKAPGDDAQPSAPSDTEEHRSEAYGGHGG